MKKALQLASVASMIDQFNLPNIELLQSLGYHVDVVADYKHPGNISIERAEELNLKLIHMGATPIDIPIPRALNFTAILRSYELVKKLVTTERYDLIHCHSPIGGAIARIAARNERKNGTKVIYTAHGFHFYDGAPMKNWLVFYPVEKYLSKYTDVLITINREDYGRAIKKLQAKQTVYVPGIGIDTEKFSSKHRGGDIRAEFGLKRDDIMLLSVGELNDNKNHESVIKALGQLKSMGTFPNNLYYIVVGKGEKKEKLKQIIKNNGLEKNIKLAGFRNNIADFYDAADVFVFPSFREGLSVSLMEAMASGLPVICSKIRGNTDLIDAKGGVLFDPGNVSDIVKAIQKILSGEKDSCGANNLNKVKSFDIKIVEESMRKIYVGS